MLLLYKEYVAKRHLRKHELSANVVPKVGDLRKDLKSPTKHSVFFTFRKSNLKFLQTQTGVFEAVSFVDLLSQFTQNKIERFFLFPLQI